MHKFEPFEKIMKIVSSGTMQGFLILGLSLISVMIIICIVGFWLVSRLFGWLIKIVILFFSTVCFLALLFPTTVFYILRSMARDLPFSIDAEKGLAGTLFLGAAIAAAAMLILASLMMAFL
jgi:hypothetical protein